jgi:hypothetical protein
MVGTCSLILPVVIWNRGMSGIISEFRLVVIGSNGAYWSLKNVWEEEEQPENLIS